MKYTLTLLLLAVATVYGCKKDDNTTPKNDTYRLTYISTMRDHLNISYANAKVSEVRFEIPSMTGGQPYVQFKQNYTYLGDKIQKVQYSSGSWRNLIYDNEGRLVKVMQNDTTTVYEMEYISHMLVSVMSYRENAKFESYAFFYGDNQNIQQMAISHHKLNPAQIMVHRTVYDFTGYDDKKNPRFALTGIEDLAQILIYDFAYSGLDFFVKCQNNYTGWTRRREMTDGSKKTETCTTTYEYNDAGFPTSRTDVIKDAAGTTITDTRSYSYSK